MVLCDQKCGAFPLLALILIRTLDNFHMVPRIGVLSAIRFGWLTSETTNYVIYILSIYRQLHHLCSSSNVPLVLLISIFCRALRNQDAYYIYQRTDICREVPSKFVRVASVFLR